MFFKVCQCDSLYFTNAELQCKWASMIFSGKKSLPSRDFMLNEINSVKSKRKFNSEHAIHLDRVIVMDQIATELGVLPDFDQIKQNDPKLYDMIWNK